VKVIVFKRGGQPGEVAINLDRVTHIASASGPFTDIHFGDQRVSVDGTFRQVIERILCSDDAPPAPAPRHWMPAR
jgi:hypothetical protein